MKHVSTELFRATPVALLLALPLATVSSVEGPLVFLPDADSEVERTYTWSEVMETSELSFTQDGEDAADAPRAESSIDRRRTLSVSDRFVRSATNQPLEFIRGYDDTTTETSGKLIIEAMGGKSELPMSGEGTSELEGVAVRFVWDERKEEWKKSYAEDYEGDDELLEPLEMTNEFIVLLPEPETDMKEGDEWDLDASLIRELLLPGGVLPVTVETDLDALEGVLDPLRLPGVFETLEGNASGSMGARVSRVDEHLVTISVEIDVTIRSDQVGAIEGLLMDALPEGVEGELTSADYATTIEGKADLIWNTSAGRAESFELDAEVTMKVEMDVDVDAGGQASLFELDETRTGKIALTVQ